MARCSQAKLGNSPDVRTAPAALTSRCGHKARAHREERNVALFMDVHNLGGPVTGEDVAKAHAADLQVQDEHDVHYLRYWVDEGQGKIFCLVDAPSPEVAAEVPRKAHGLVADEIHPVQQG